MSWLPTPWGDLLEPWDLPQKGEVFGAWAFLCGEGGSGQPDTFPLVASMKDMEEVYAGTA